MEHQPLAEDLQQVFNSEEVQQFIKATDRFRTLLKSEDIDIKDFINQSSLSLTELYYRSRNLPKIVPKYSTSADYEPSLLEWGYSKTIEKLGSLVNFYSINPYIDDDSQMADSTKIKSLSEELSSIYFDVNICLGLMSKGTNKSVEQALIAFKLKFDTLLGIQCLEVIHVLQYLRYWELPYLKMTDETMTLQKNRNLIRQIHLYSN